MGFPGDSEVSHTFGIRIHTLFIYLHYSFTYLFVHLILVEHFYRFILTLNTFEDVNQPLAVEMYMITCLLHAQHAFQQHKL